MKKLLMGLFITLLWMGISFGATSTYTKNCLVGGTSNCLDSIDGDDLAEGYRALVITSTKNYHYYLNATSGATDDGVNVIAPDVNPGNKRWVLTKTSVDIAYYPNAGAADQGVTGGNNTLKYYNTLLTGSSGIIKLLPGTYTLTTSLTLSDGVSLKIDPGAIVDIATGVTLTFADGAYLDTGDGQCFSGLGNVAGLKEAKPEYWGDADDDTVFFQKANAAAGTVILSEKRYKIDSAPSTVDRNNKAVGVTMPAKFKLKGAGPGKTFVEVGSNFPLSAIAFFNESGAAAQNTYHDADITIEGITFTDSRVYPAWNEDTPATYGAGLTAADLTGGVLRFFSCLKPVVRNCEFDEIRVIAVAFGGCMEPRFEKNNVHDCGYLYRGTYPVWISSDPHNSSNTKKALVTDNFFTDIDFSGMFCGAGVEEATIIGNKYINTKEAAIHLGDQCAGAVIVGNTIDGVYLGDISAHGIEGQNVLDATITGNVIKNCDAAGLAFVGIQKSVISGNTIKDNGAATTYPLGTSSLILGINGNAYSDLGKAGIKIINSTTNIVDDLLITGNCIKSTTGVGVQKYAISLGQTTPSLTYDAVAIIGNDLAGGGTVDEIYYGANALAASNPDMRVYGNTTRGEGGISFDRYIELESKDPTPSANDIAGQIEFFGLNSAAERIGYAKILGMITDTTDGAEDGRIRIDSRVNGTKTLQVSIGDGVVLGFPTGSYKGTGTLNAVAVYDDGTIVTTDYVYQAYQDGFVDTERWDSEQASNFSSELWQFDIDTWSDFQIANQRLPAFQSELDFAKNGNLSTGDMIQRLLETVEVMSIHIIGLNERVKELENN